MCIYNKYIGNRPRAPTAVYLSRSLSIPIEDGNILQVIRVCTNERDTRISIMANIKQTFKSKKLYYFNEAPLQNQCN